MKRRNRTPKQEIDAAVMAGTRVQHGAAILDSRIPGWLDMIDPAKLDIADGELCVLGQLYPEEITEPVWKNMGFPSRQVAIELGISASVVDDRVCSANYEVGIKVLGLSQEDAIWYGFFVDELAAMDEGVKEVNYKDLDVAWEKLIRARKEALVTAS